MYRFKSPATGDVLMLTPQGDQLLRLIGREPSGQGIIEVAAMANAIELLQAAAQADALQRGSHAARAAQDIQRESGAETGQVVSLAQRVWPFVDMLRRAQATDKPIVWGV